MLLITTSTGHGLFSFINPDDLERPSTSQKGVFANLFAMFGCNAHFKSELQRNG